MPRKVVCACGQALMVPDHYTKPAARCSSCGGMVQIPTADGPGSILDLPPIPQGSSGIPNPYGNSPYQSTYVDPNAGYNSAGPQPTYGLPPPPSNPGNSFVMWVIIAIIGGGLLVVCGCGGLVLFPAMQSARRAARDVQAKNEAMRNDMQRQLNIPPPQPQVIPSGLAPPTPSPAVVTTSWNRFLNRPGRFEIDMPGSVQESRQNPQANSPSMQRFLVNTSAHGTFFVVVHDQENFTEILKSKPIADVLKEACDAIKTREQSTNYTASNMFHEGMEGRELIMRLRQNGQNRHYQGRIVLFDGILYEWAWIGWQNQQSPGDVARFLHSLKFRRDLPALVVAAAPARPAENPPAPPVTPVIPPPVTPPPIQPPPSPPGGVAGTPGVLAERDRKHIHFRLKIQRRHLEMMEKMQKDNASRNVPSDIFKGQVERVTADFERAKDDLARQYNLDRAKIEEILREGDEKKW